MHSWLKEFKSHSEVSESIGKRREDEIADLTRQLSSTKYQTRNSNISNSKTPTVVETSEERNLELQLKRDALLNFESLPFKTAKELMKGQPFIALYQDIIANYKFFRESETEIEAFMVSIYELSLESSLKLEDPQTDTKAYFNDLEKWSNSSPDPSFHLFNDFQMALFLRFCAFMIDEMYKEETESKTIKHDLFKLLCIEESDKIAHLIGYEFKTAKNYLGFSLSKGVNIAAKTVYPQEMTPTKNNITNDAKNDKQGVEDKWLIVAEDILRNGDSNFEENMKKLLEDETVLLLYNQLIQFQDFFATNTDDVLRYCQRVKDDAIAHAVKLEKQSAAEVMQRVFFDSPFEKYIAYKFYATYISNIDKNGNVKHNNNHYTFTKEHYYFKLECNDKAKEIVKIGFQFIDADNVLGWQLIKVESNAPLTKSFEKIDWKGNQALLAYLFRQLENHGMISNKNYVEYISNHFSLNGNDINKNSLKTAVNKARLDIKDYRDKTLPEKKVENITVHIPKLNEIINDIENIISK